MSSSPDFLVENHAAALNGPFPSESALLQGVELRFLTPPAVSAAEPRPNSSKAAVPSASDYDPEIYRPEIDKALAHAKRILRRRVVFIKGMPTKSQGDMDFEDLVQDVNTEILQAMRQYNDQMNAQLAYRIAENRAQAFLRKRIESQTVRAVDAEGNPVLDEFGLARGLNSAELKRQSEDLSATPEDRKKAKRLVWRYARTFPRFVPLEKPKGEDNEGAAEVKAEHQIFTSRHEVDAEPVWLQDIVDREEILALRRLISTWHGDKRRVAEAMLEPDFTVRGVPSLDKSKVSRISRGVLKDRLC